jgi:hypothetical protein
MIEEQASQHYEVLREVMADKAMRPDSKYATISRPEYFRQVHGRYIATPERGKLHKQWIKEVIDQATQKGPIGTDRKAIVMAGPPGAGKGTVQRTEFQDFPGYVQCDPDAFKEKIIEHELRSGRLNELKTPKMLELEARGHKFAPMELAALVHEESSILSKQIQQDLQRAGMNYVVDTVLKSESSARDVATNLHRAGYTYDVVSVQTSAEISKAGIYHRWASEYAKFLGGKNELGGRPVPSEFASSVFPDKRGPSTTESAARWLAENGRGAQSLQQFRRSENRPPTKEIDLVKRHGMLVPRAEALHQTGLPLASRPPVGKPHLGKAQRPGIER